MPSVFIAGATGGIGSALATEYANRGWSVALLARDAAAMEALARTLEGARPGASVQTASADADTVGTTADAVAALIGACGTPDLAIYASGAMTPTTHDVMRDMEAFTDMLRVNVIGAAEFVESVLPPMRALGRGHVAALGSIAGERGRKGNPMYGASKAALHAYLEGVRNREAATGIRVSTIKPGFVRTRMLGEGKYPGAIEPSHAARIIADRLAASAESFFVPRWWGGVALGLHVTPRGLFKRIGPA